jgi:Ni/Fe-hydrogenase 1 B-type cytochrome subunit
MAASQLIAERHPLAYRIMHEMWMASILLLIVTGFYIHRPFIGGGGFLMSLMRGVHYFLAAVLIIIVVFRIVSMFSGKNRDWPSFIPDFDDLKLIPQVIAYYLHLGDMPELKKKYNPLQMLSYSGAFLLAIFQIISGFALQYPDALGWFTYGLFNNEIEVRLAHYITTWAFLLFLMVHVYLSIRDAQQEIKALHLMRAEEAEEVQEVEKVEELVIVAEETAEEQSSP